MTVETASLIHELNALLPDTADGLTEGDNHIRLLKAAIKATFPNVTGPVTKTHTEINNLQASSASLEAIKALTPAANKLPYFTSGTVAALADLSSFARTILDDADAAAVRSTLGLAAMALKATVATGDIDNDAVTFAKVQNITDNRLLGRSAGSDGDMQHITVGTGLTLSGGTLAAAGDSFATKLFHAQHQLASGTNSGGQASGSYATRTLNALLTNEISGSSLSGNQITNLPAGTYYIDAVGNFAACDKAKLKLRNITDGTDILIGVASDAGSGIDNGPAHLYGRFTLAGTKTLAVQSRVSTTNTTNGWGIPCTFGDTEVYLDVKLWKIA